MIHVLQYIEGMPAMVRVKVRELAQDKGFTISSLQRAADVNYRTVLRLWNEPQKDVSLSTLEKIAAALGVRVADLLDERDSENKEGA